MRQVWGGGGAGYVCGVSNVEYSVNSGEYRICLK